MKDRKGKRGLKAGRQIIWQKINKNQKGSLSKRRRRRNKKPLNVTSKPLSVISKKKAAFNKQKEVKMYKQTFGMIPGLDNVVFDTQKKNDFQKVSDTILHEKYEQVSHSPFISNSFAKFQTKPNHSIISNPTQQAKEDPFYQVHLHHVLNNTNSQFLIGFISCSILPELKEVELFLREDFEDYKSMVSSTFFTIKFAETFFLSRQQMLSLFTFNVNYLKDFLQEGAQFSSHSFEHFMTSKESVKFLQVLLRTPKEQEEDCLPIDFTLMEMFNNQKIKNLKQLADFHLRNVFLKYHIVSEQINNNQDQNLSPISSDDSEFIKQCTPTADVLRFFEDSSDDKDYKENSDDKSESSVSSKNTNQNRKLDSDTFNEPQILPNIKQVLENPKFQETLKRNLVRHSFILQDYCQIIEIFNPCTITMWDFLSSLSSTLGWSISQTRKKLHIRNEVTDIEMQTDTLYKCIYSESEKYLNDHAQFFHLIRKHFLLSQGIQLLPNIASPNIENGEEGLREENQNVSPESQPQTKKNAQKSFEYPTFNRKNPLILCKKVGHLRNYDYLNEQHVRNNKSCLQSVWSKDFLADGNKFNLMLLPMEHFYLSVQPLQTANDLMISYSIFSQMKDIMVVREFASAQLLDNAVNPELLIESLSLQSYSKQRNLELLEVIGDVVIKYISSLFLVHYLPKQNENMLTSIRSQYINNKFLGVAAFSAGLHFFIKSKRPTAYDWRYNFFDKQIDGGGGESKVSTVKLNYTNLSDALESVIGAFYASNHFQISPCLDIINGFGLMIDRKLKQYCERQVTGSFLIPDLIMESFTIHEDMTYTDLQIIGKKLLLQSDLVNFQDHLVDPDSLQGQCKDQNQNKMFIWNMMNVFMKQELAYQKEYEVEFVKNDDQNKRREDRRQFKKYRRLHEQSLEIVVKNFELDCIGYSFKNKQLLINALNCYENAKFKQYQRDYQILEFLGDSLIEILVVTNGYNYSRNKLGRIDSPYLFCEMKSLLLSNDFLSRMTVLFNFHYYALNISMNQQEEIKQFVSDCDLTSKFKESVIHQANSPKVLGDLWESIAGAILMDSDIQTFTQVYGRLYAPYIAHFITYYDKIIFNEKEKVQLVAQQTHSQLECTTEVTKEDDTYKIKKTVFIKEKLIGKGIDFNEQLAEKKAYHDAYQTIFITKTSNLGLVYQGKQV